MPFFSIVIPAYNRATFIGPLIQSIRDQTFRDYEVIIVDDGSKDNTRDVVQQLMSTEPRLRYIYQENAERGAARNNGYLHSTGTYVMFFDSDDHMPKDNLENMHHLIANNPDYNLYASKIIFKRGEDADYFPPVYYYKPGSYGLEIVLKGNPIGTLFTVKKSFNQFKHFPHEREFATMEDWMCLVRNLKEQKILLGDFVGCYINDHDDRSMSNNQDVIRKRMKATERIIKDVSLNNEQIKTLYAYSYHFCSIHSYIDNDRKGTIYYLLKAIRTGGINKDFVLTGIKGLIGKKLINKLK